MDDPKYAALAAVLERAYQQSAEGKGRERHANDLPFIQQPILSNTRLFGPGFPMGQAVKKVQEAAGMIRRGAPSSAVFECLGAIVYLSAAIIGIEETFGNGATDSSAGSISDHMRKVVEGAKERGPFEPPPTADASAFTNQRRVGKSPILAAGYGKDETRETFVVPDGMRAVRDAEGRATGEVEPIPPEEVNKPE